MAGFAPLLDAANTQDQVVPVAGPLIGLRVSASRTLWRLGPAWAVLAGALASGVPLISADVLLRVAGAVLLADSAWGAVWVPVAGDRPRPEVTGHAAVQAADAVPPAHWPLPYMQANSPAARLRAMLPDARWHDILVAVLLTGGLAALLGLPALLISVAALLVTLWALFVVQEGIQPALPRALLNVGLPWLLGLTLNQENLQGLVSQAGAWSGVSVSGLALGAAFTLLDWGSQRACWSCRSRARAVWLGETAVFLVLVALRMPWTTGLVAALLLPPTLFALRGTEPPGPEGEQPRLRAAALARSGPWWWAAMMVAALGFWH